MAMTFLCHRAPNSHIINTMPGVGRAAHTATTPARCRGAAARGRAQLSHAHTCTAALHLPPAGILLSLARWHASTRVYLACTGLRKNALANANLFTGPHCTVGSFAFERFSVACGCLPFYLWIAALPPTQNTYTDLA